MGRNQPIATAVNSDPKVLRVQPVQNDPTRILVTALAPGRSQLTLEDLKKNTELIHIVVDDEQPKMPAAPLRPGETEIALLDGSVVRVAALFDKIDVVTSFGKLSVPREDIRAIEFGRHLPDGG